MRRFSGRGCILEGWWANDEFHISIRTSPEVGGFGPRRLGSAPSLVEALNEALETALLTDEFWRDEIADDH